MQEMLYKTRFWVLKTIKKVKVMLQTCRGENITIEI